MARLGLSGGSEEGNLVVAPSATLRPFDCPQGRAVGVFDAVLYGLVEAVPFRVGATLDDSGWLRWLGVMVGLVKL